MENIRLNNNEEIQENSTCSDRLIGAGNTIDFYPTFRMQDSLVFVKTLSANGSQTTKVLCR